MPQYSASSILLERSSAAYASIVFTEVRRRLWYDPSLEHVPYTNGFRPLELLQHYADHGSEFGANGPIEYERMADDFWANPKQLHVQECRRGRGDLVRFDPMTNGYSVIDHANVIRTFFKPVPCASVALPQRATMKMAGQCHSEATNLIYFRVRCKQW